MKRDRLRVLFLTSSYPRSHEDTASIFLRHLAEHLSACDTDVHVLAPAHGAGCTAVEPGVTVHRFQYFPSGIQNLAYGSGMLPNLKRAPWLWLQVPFFMIAMARALRRLLAQERFDAIHAHWILPAGLIGALAKRRAGVPLIVSAHGTDAFALSGRWQLALKNQVIRSSSAWTANTQRTAQALGPLATDHPPRVIQMGVDLARFSNGSGALLRAGLAAGEFLLLFVGRLIENKGCRDLLHALALLEPEVRGRTKLWIVGDGDQRNQLERAAQDLGIGEKVRFFGAMSQQRLPDFYAAADLVVVPSKAGTSGEMEGQSVVVLEAFAARACVVATRLGGIPSMVRDRMTGVLAEAGDPADLAEAIESLLKNADLRKALTANAFAEVSKYDWRRIADEFLELYQYAVKMRAVASRRSR